jgi:hypothetical protein
MPSNPERASRGGDVEGTKKILVTQGEPIEVAAASYDPGYPLDNTLSDADTKIAKSDLLRGYASYGKAIGEA